jgi:hypothetical protein
MKGEVDKCKLHLKSFIRSEHGCYQALGPETVEFVCSKRKAKVLACEVIK